MAAIVIQEREKKLAKILAAVAVVALVLPEFASQWSSEYLARESARRNKLESKVADLSERLAGIEDQRQLLRRFIDDYRRWDEMGALDPHNLVPRVRAMEGIKDERKLFQIAFNFGEARPLDPEASKFTEGGTASINLMDMRVEMDMLHDLDFLMFMESLDRQSDALFFPTACDLERSSAEFALRQRVNMKAACTVKWMAMTDPERGNGDDQQESDS